MSKINIYQITDRAIRWEYISVSDKCELCGILPERTVHTHHLDYNNPFLVVQLCSSCHRKIHSKKGLSNEENQKVLATANARAMGKTESDFKTKLAQYKFDARQAYYNYKRIYNIEQRNSTCRIFTLDEINYYKNYYKYEEEIVFGYGEYI